MSTILRSAHVDRWLCSLCLLVGSASIACTQSNDALALFFQTRYTEALPLFERTATAHPEDMETRTWLAETYRRLGKNDEALRTAYSVLAHGDCSSFAHCVIAQASIGNADSLRTHVRAAVACDPVDPNVWLMMWGEAMKENDPALHDTCIRKMVETGFFTTAALAYGRTELRRLPEHAILFTSGDMDTYPALAVQVTEGFRTDVAVVEREHPGIAWARRFLRTYKNVPFPRPESELASWKETTDSTGTITPVADRIFRAMIDANLPGSVSRPIAIAPTVDPAFYSTHAKGFRNHGMFMLWEGTCQNDVPDTAALRACISDVRTEEFTGAWTSTKDRSPVRRFYTNRIAGVISGLYLTYAEALIRAGRPADADEMLHRGEAFESRMVMGLISGDEIARLRGMMPGTAHRPADPIPVK